MRTMYDSVTANNIPVNAQIVAGYCDGIYAWSGANWARFPNSIKVRIAVHASTNDGHVLDVEKGDATAAQCPGWIRMRQRAGIAVPTIYCGRYGSGYSLNEIHAACAGLTYDVWLADYTQQPHIPSDVTLCQYADPGPVDISLCPDFWPRGSAPLPIPDLAIGGDMGLVALTQHPVTKTRVDIAWVGPDHHVMHGWWDTATNTSAQQDLAGDADERFGVSVAYSPDGNSILFTHVGQDGALYWGKGINTVWGGWNLWLVQPGSIQVKPLGPTMGTAGTPGAPGTAATHADVVASLKAALAAAEGAVV